MLETVSQGFKSATERLRGIRELSDENIAESLSDVRRSLLEADVDFQVVKDFLARVKQRALGEKVKTHARERGGRKLKVSPGQHFVSICEEELVNLMGPVDTELQRSDGAISIMLVGLQGVGKTTIAERKRICVMGLNKRTRRYRETPASPRLMQLLQQAYDGMPEGQVSLSGLDGWSLDRRSKRAAELAGLRPWPKFHQAMRASFENDLKVKGVAEATYSHWLGHSPEVSRRHYTSPLDAEFQIISE